MPLRFRSVVPYTLPGVLALIGCWWYISRKKGRITSHDSPEGVPPAIDFLRSPSEGSNGLVERVCVSPDSPPTAPHPAAQVLAQVTKASPAPQRSTALAAPHPVHTSSQESPGALSSALLPPAAEGSPASPAPLQHLAGTCGGPAAALLIEPAWPCRATQASPGAAERPEPEGEVASQEVAVPCGTPLLKDLHDTSTKEELLPPIVLVQGVVSPQVEHVEAALSLQVSHYHALSTPGPALNSTLASEHSQAPRQSGGEEQEFELLAAGLITEVISAATLEVLGDGCSDTADPCPPGYSSTPLANGRPLYQQPSAPLLLEGPSPVSCGSREEEHRLPNGFSPCPAWQPPEEGVHSSRRSPPQSAGGPASQGGSSEDPPEDPQAGVVPGGEAEDQDGHVSALAESVVRAVYDLKRFNGIGLGNGIGEVETDQSGGSDVNSMDSVDSGCTMGPGESQSNSATSSSSELIIWEIEVPKHLVGRLIGKQGRYVSFLKQNSGAKIYISTLPYTQEFQICHIEGTQQQVDKALSLIGKKFKDLDLTNLYAPPPLTLPSLPMTSWLLLPSGVTVEIIVVNIVSAGHVFVQQHTHPTYHALRSLDQQMFLCYSQPGTPGLPSPAEVGVICAAPALEGAWWRAQVITFYKETNEVEIRYVDYGGYDRVKIDLLRQIRSDFVTLPFQGAEVLLDNIAPLPGEDRFSTEATSALEEITRGVALLAQVSNYDNNTGLPLVQLWNMAGEELISVNRTLAERGLGTWVDSF